MNHVIDWEALGGAGPTRFLFEGAEYGADVSLFVVDFSPGRGPRLHRHPYEEVFVIHDGVANFTIGADTLEAAVGQVVVVPAGTPHTFVNSGTTRLRLTSVHPRARVEQEDLED